LAKKLNETSSKILSKQPSKIQVGLIPSAAHGLMR